MWWPGVHSLLADDGLLLGFEFQRLLEKRQVELLRFLGLREHFLLRQRSRISLQRWSLPSLPTMTTESNVSHITS